jgi:hypothetical protein
MSPNPATPEPGAGVSGDFGGFHVSQGRDEGTRSGTANPRNDTAKALADAVVLALRSGDLVAARAAAKALEAFVDALCSSERQTVADMQDARRNRDAKTG